MNNIENLKHLIPNFEKELEEEKAKAIKYALAYLSEEYSHFETSLMSMMKKYDELILKGYEGIPAKHRAIIGGYTYIFKKPHNVIEEEKAKIVAKVESEFASKIQLMEEEYIQALIGEEIKEQTRKREEDLKLQEEKLKQELIDTLFKS
ncbi:hypothetical protein [Vibrio cyclitrophicus]|uniref:hypothetical protein n=1 Tax=Vibrio cyclitrophicus TaxID=47951 RepID=UPI00031A7FB8|nr:hypothetical protein [Vibrio cyclitrophicus]OEF27346.1 hypothetical protein OA9_14370 [Vibrio cyclitrophicus 1F97]